MRSTVVTVGAVGALAIASLAAPQDPIKSNPKNYQLVMENATVRVLKVSVAPAGKTPAHAHPDSLLVPLSDGKARFTLADGKTEDAVLGKEKATFTPAGTHAGANIGTDALDAILVEFKTPAPGKATLPTSRPGMQQTVLAESPRAVAFKTTTAPDFQEPAGTTHDYDQVVIALGPGEINLVVDGQAPVTKWQRGDVHFVGRGVKHSSKNTGGKPADVIIVAIR